jgi:superoxide dismutase, Fe-Mn family
VIANLEIIPEDKRAAVRNNGGGHANHSLFWTTLGPNGGGEPEGALGEAVVATFGAFDVLKSQMVDAGIKRFGSGWSWLVWDGTGLAVLSTPNQDSPISDGKTPLFGIDVWEHAYYLKYQNRRPEYVANLFSIINWDNVAERLDAVRV